MVQSCLMFQRGWEIFLQIHVEKHAKISKFFFWTHTEKRGRSQTCYRFPFSRTTELRSPDNIRDSAIGEGGTTVHTFKASYRNNNWVICACVTLQICPISTGIIYLKPLFWNQSVKNHIYERFWANWGKNLHVHAPKQFTRAEIRKLTQHVVIIVRVPLMMLPWVQLCGFCV